MRTVFRTHGFLLILLSIFMLVPAVVDILDHNQDWVVFLISSFLCMFLGGILILANQNDGEKFQMKHAYFLTTTIWISISFFAALPFYFATSGYHLSMTDAMFESVSGFTTTGSTVYVKLDSAPRGILLWRSITQLIGGIGIVVLSMTVFPYLKVGGMQLFQSESSDRSDKILPRVQQVANASLAVYVLLIVLCTIAYKIGGMTTFDAINHSVATISTGGYSTHDTSFAYFESSFLQWSGTIFMILGGSPLLLFFYFVIGKKPNRPLLSQARSFWFGICLVSTLIALWISYYLNMDFSDALRVSAFNVASIVTTTGFASADYTLWGGFIVIILYFLTIAGGCTGSTSGGIKIFRFQVMIKMLILQTKRLVKPNAIFSENIAGQKITDDVARSVGVFFILFICLFCITTIVLTLTGLDFITSLSGAATAIANVGPGFGSIIGPTGNFAPLSDPAKWMLTFAMLAGRLEIMTMLVLFTKGYWEDFFK